MIQYIYASKIFKQSSNQDKILANLASPINKELVLQLEEYLDEETIQKYSPSESSEFNAEWTEDDSFSDGFSEDSGTQSSPSPSAPSHSGGSFTPSKSELMDDLAEEESHIDDAFVEQPTQDSSSTTTDTTNTDVESSIQVGKGLTFRENKTKTNISSSTDPISFDVLQGTLNSNEDLCGTTRVAVKETDDSTEVWIYYSDDINLNGKLFSIVQYVEQMYHSLSFNRMARSDNAVVFDLIQTGIE